MNTPTLALVLAAALAAPALAQDGGGGNEMDHAAMGHGTPAEGAEGPEAEWQALLSEMHVGMAVPYSGDADADFLKGMIPHHQGALDMAEWVLRHGSDPEVRALAEAIIAAQVAEIALMEEMLAARGDGS